MDLQGELIRRITFPLWMHRLDQSDVAKHVRSFSALAGERREVILARQEESVSKMMSLAANSTDFYRDWFSAHDVHPDDGVSALRKLAPLTKQIIRADDIKRFVNRNLSPGDLVEASTGGSTGLPLRFYRSKRCLALRKAQDIFLDSWIGLRVGDAVGLFVSASHHDDRASWKEAVRNQTLDRLLRCDPSRLDDSYLQEFHQRLLRFSPRFLKCFPSSLAVYTRYLRKNGLCPPSVVGITSTGETLHDWQRESFEQAFHAPVFERYGTKESGLIAAHCKSRQGLHVFSPGAFVEVIKPDGSPCGVGEVGSILVTDLFNDGMPLIRYSIGDLAIVGPSSGCACGTPFPTLKKILGRDRDLVIGADMNARPGYLFVEEINAASLDVQFQILQREPGEIDVRVLRGSNVVPEQLELVLERFRKLMAGGRVTLTEVDQLPRDASGKYPYVVSEPGRRFQGAPVSNATAGGA